MQNYSIKHHTLVTSNYVENLITKWNHSHTTKLGTS